MAQRLFLACMFWVTSSVFAVDLELTQGINAALPIGINSFGGDEQAVALKSIVASDLSLSGQFKLIQAPSPSSISQWQQAGADTVLTGQVQPIGANRYNVRFELLDAAAHGKLLLGKSYQVGAGELRALSHHISDEIYQQLTGERGIFSTRIAYILVQRQGDNARFSLDVADVDGNNPQSLLVSSEPIMSPTWSPDGRQIACVSFEKKKAQIFVIEVATGKRRLISSFEGINGAPTWSPDGRQMAVVLSKSGKPKIYLLNMSTGDLKQATFGEAIDTEPRFSPDGRTLLFTSGRGGTPQVYRLTLADGSIARMTFDGNYNARATYTPNLKSMVMLHRGDSQFSIGVQDMNSGRVTPLTDSSFDESPTVSPNGRLVLYATRVNDQGILAMVSIDGRSHVRLPARAGDIQEPAWSPYLG